MADPKTEMAQVHCKFVKYRILALILHFRVDNTDTLRLIETILMNTSREIGTILSYRIFGFLIIRQRRTTSNGIVKF